MQRIFVITALNGIWSNIGALIEADEVPHVGTNYVFSPCLFINKSATRKVFIRSNGSTNALPNTDVGLTLEVAGNAKDAFEFPIFDARTAWIIGDGGTAIIEVVAYPKV